MNAETLKRVPLPSSVDMWGAWPMGAAWHAYTHTHTHPLPPTHPLTYPHTLTHKHKNKSTNTHIHKQNTHYCILSARFGIVTECAHVRTGYRILATASDNSRAATNQERRLIEQIQ